ncbi:MAG: galactose-1-epimerase, partial [Butyricicoccus sp.]
MNITSEYFGETKDGIQIERYWLTDGRYSAAILTLGGVIQSLCVPDKNGNTTDVVLGFDNVGDYEMQNCYIGA